MFNINEEINYVIRKPENNEAIVLFKSYFPMNDDEVIVSIFYEGLFVEGEVVVDRVTKENLNEFEKLDTCRIVSNLNDR